MQRPARPSRHHSAAQRERIIAAYRRSDLTQREFASEAGIGHSTLTLWLRKSTGAKPAERPAFVAVPNVFAAPAARAPAYRLQLPGGLSVEIAAGFQPAELTALLQVVQSL
jgi:transposase-like protein